MQKRLIFIFLGIFILGIIGSYGIGFYLGNQSKVCAVCKPEYVDFSLFWETWQKVEQKFIEPEKIDVQKMVYGAISGMLNSLKDPYTVFFDPKTSKTFSEDISGKFEGVGMEIGRKNDELKVISPLEGTPAQKAGLRPGDIILEIDGTSTSGMSVEEAVDLIRGPKGTEVTLNIFRDSWKETKKITVARAIIEIPSLKWELKENDIVYIKIFNFTEKSKDDFDKAAFQILKTSGKKIVLDLRNNPGGYLDRAQDIAGWFLKRGEIVTIEDKRGDEKTEYKSQGDGYFANYPIVCLINEGSASAAEILAGALRDNLGIKLIGKKSFGKGTVQELIHLSNDSDLKITIAKWLTPKGESINDVGLKPDIEVDLTEDDYKNEKDPQLDKAIEIIKGM
ncbi:MAG: S41 family peptidase [Candidatus Nealsonbacteria bacterium]|nr:S41 family peptidase [Candidatus Nealsonbacteria bacterium]